MSRYFLIARYRKDNQFEILKINDEWYMPEGKALGRFSKENDLEAIDLVTSNFDNALELSQRLLENGYINDLDVDICIASKKSKNDTPYIRFDEVIYASSNKYRINELRKIAANSLDDNLNQNKEAMGNISEQAISSAYINSDFIDMIREGGTNISKSFAEKLITVPYYSELPEELKYDKLFSFGSYREVRNVVEALNRLAEFSSFSRNDRASMNQEYIDKNLEGRLAISPNLLFTFDQDYCEGQISLDDYLKGVNEKSKISTDEMRREIFRVFDSVPVNIFGYNGKYWFFNANVFACPISKSELADFNRLLKGNIPPYLIHSYASNKKHMQVASELGECHEASELMEMWEDDKTKMKKLLKKPGAIENVYQWCMLYEKCQDRAKDYLENGSRESMVADAKIFGKKK